MTQNTIDAFSSLFLDDPWSLSDEAVFPRGTMLLSGDLRFWVAKTEHNSRVFFIKAIGDIDGLKVPELLGVDVELINRANDEYVLKLTVLESSLNEKFQIVVKHLVYKIYELSGVSLYRAAFRVLEEWSHFLKPSMTGVDRSVLIGLWGEIYILKNYFNKILGTSKAIQSWIGAEGKKQDFSINDKSFELKTTLSGDSRDIKISSLDQLDKMSNQLFLVFLRIDRATDHGHSLNELVEGVLSEIDDEITRICFLNKVHQVLGKASEEQVDEKFLLGDLVIYEIADQFPCLTSDSVPSGIISASYQITLNSIKEFKIENELCEILIDD